MRFPQFFGGCGASLEVSSAAVRHDLPWPVWTSPGPRGLSADGLLSLSVRERSRHPTVQEQWEKVPRHHFGMLPNHQHGSHINSKQVISSTLFCCKVFLPMAGGSK